MTNYDPNQNPYGGSNDPSAYPSGQPGYQQYPGQAQPGGGYAPGMSPFGASTEKNNLGGWALGLGIASLVCCGLFTGIPAIILGYLGMQAAKEGRASNKGMAIAGLIMGSLSIVWTIVALSTGILGQIVGNAS